MKWHRDDAAFGATVRIVGFGRSIAFALVPWGRIVLFFAARQEQPRLAPRPHVLAIRADVGNLRLRPGAAAPYQFTTFPLALRDDLYVRDYETAVQQFGAGTIERTAGGDRNGSSVARSAYHQEHRYWKQSARPRPSFERIRDCDNRRCLACRDDAGRDEPSRGPALKDYPCRSGKLPSISDRARFVGNVGFISGAEASGGEEPASRPAPLHRDQAGPELASKKLLVEIVVREIERIVGLHRIPIIGHDRIPVFVPYGRKSFG